MYFYPTLNQENREILLEVSSLLFPAFFTANSFDEIRLAISYRFDGRLIASVFIKRTPLPLPDIEQEQLRKMISSVKNNLPARDTLVQQYLIQLVNKIIYIYPPLDQNRGENLILQSSDANWFVRQSRFENYPGTLTFTHYYRRTIETKHIVITDIQGKDIIWQWSNPEIRSCMVNKLTQEFFETKGILGTYYLIALSKVIKDTYPNAFMPLIMKYQI